MGIMAQFQISLYNKLSGDTTLMELVQDIGEWPDEDTVYPHVTIGEDRELSWMDKSGRGYQITAVIHSWVQDAPLMTLKAIMDRIDFLLEDHGEGLTMDPSTGFCFTVPPIGIKFAPTMTMNDPDGKTKHGRAEYVFKLKSL